MKTTTHTHLALFAFVLGILLVPLSAGAEDNGQTCKDLLNSNCYDCRVKAVYEDELEEEEGYFQLVFDDICEGDECPYFAAYLPDVTEALCYCQPKRFGDPQWFEGPNFNCTGYPVAGDNDWYFASTFIEGQVSPDGQKISGQGHILDEGGLIFVYKCRWNPECDRENDNGPTESRDKEDKTSDPDKKEDQIPDPPA